MGGYISLVIMYILIYKRKRTLLRNIHQSNIKEKNLGPKTDTSFTLPQ
jgi:heme exporter protein D